MKFHHVGAECHADGLTDGQVDRHG